MTRMRLRAAFEIAAVTAVSAARTVAHGQAATSMTVRALKNCLVMTKVAITARAPRPVSLFARMSARLSAGARFAKDTSTRRTIRPR